MVRIMTYVVDVLLVLFIVREVLEFARRYSRLKRDVAQGDREARSRLYRRALRFQWASAALALTGLRFDWNALRPGGLALDSSPLVNAFASAGSLRHGALSGIGMGVGLGTLAMVVLRLRARRKDSSHGAPVARVAPWRRLVPDFTAVLPVTTRERWLWLAVAISAGVCEEVVFRGWLLSVLHDPLGLTGTALIVVAAVGFGLAHAYQGPGGMVLTGLAGALFCTLYVASGDLLVPILLHTVVDARFALLPAAGAGGRKSGQPAPGAVAEGAA
jgi:membrane protease YdiL (CAAX protease family)